MWGLSTILRPGEKIQVEARFFRCGFRSWDPWEKLWSLRDFVWRSIENKRWFYWFHCLEWSGLAEDWDATVRTFTFLDQKRGRFGLGSKLRNQRDHRFACFLRIPVVFFSVNHLNNSLLFVCLFRSLQSFTSVFFQSLALVVTTATKLNPIPRSWKLFRPFITDCVARARSWLVSYPCILRCEAWWRARRQDCVCVVRMKLTQVEDL